MDRDFAERIFRMFGRPHDPRWKMPDMDGPEYASKPRSFGLFDKIQDRPVRITGLEKEGAQKTGEEKGSIDWGEWLKQNFPKRIPGLPGSVTPKPPMKIVIGDKELEIDNEGRPVLRF